MNSPEKIVLSVLPNPFKPESRIIEMIEPDSLSRIGDIPGSEKLFWYANGIEKDLDYRPLPGDRIVGFPKIHDGGGNKNIAGIVAGLALMVFTGGAASGIAGVLGVSARTLGLGLALYFGGSLLAGNQKVNIETPNSSFSALDGNYGWNPDEIKLTPGNSLPLIFGEVRCSGQLIGRRITSQGIPGTTDTVQFLYLLIAVCDGQVDSITDIEINDTAIESIDNAWWEIRVGTNDQTAISGVLTNSQEQQTFNHVLPAEIAGANWITKTTTENGSRIELELVFPAGVYGINTENGAMGAVNVFIRGQYREVGGAWTDLFSTEGSPYKKIYLSTRKPYYFKHSVSVDSSKLYEFRFQNYSLTYYNGLFSWTEVPSNYAMGCNWLAMTVLDNTQETYPNTALVALGIPASENLNGSMPSASWKVTRSTVLVWNPTTEAYETKDAKNIAWQVYGLIHDCRYLKNIQTGSFEYTVFGEPAANLSYTDFNAWASACATLDNGVARAMGNLMVDAPEQIWPTIQKIAASGRAFIIQQGSVFKPVWDAPKTMTQIFTSANQFKNSQKGGFLEEKERATAIEATFNDEENGFKPKTIFVPGDDYKPSGLNNPTQVKFPGLSNKNVVYAAARFMLRKNKFLKQYIAFEADIDSIVAQLGDVVGVQSDILGIGVSGRVLGSTTAQLVVDQPITMQPGNTYSALIRDSATGTLYRKTIDSVAEETTTTTLNFTGDPFDVAIERYTMLSLGILNAEVKPYEITDIRRNSNLQATIEAIEYVEGIYSASETFPVIDYATISAGINTLTVNPDADTQKLGISWTIKSDSDYNGAVVYINGKSQGFFTTDTTSIEFDSTPGDHTVIVVPVGSNDKAGDAVTDTVTLAPATLSAVSGITTGSKLESQNDGTQLVYATASFTVPTLANTVLVEIGEGAIPSVWRTAQDSRNSAVSYGPVKPGTLYTFRFTARNNRAVSESVTATVTTTGDTEAPGAPTAYAISNLKNVTVTVNLDSPPSDMAGFRIYRNIINDAVTAVPKGNIAHENGFGVFPHIADNYGDVYYFWATSVDKWGNESGFSAVAGPVTISNVKTHDLTDLPIIGKDFRTDVGVGEDVDGVRFTADGIEMWQGGVCRVWIPKTGDPVFDGTLTAGAGYIGSWQIFPGYLQSENIRLDSAGSIQTVDFVSGHRGWKLDNFGRAELLDVWARGAVKTVVFEKDEVSVIGGEFLVRPAGLVSAYDYDAFVDEKANAALSDRWAQLADLVDSSDAAPTFDFADYDDYYDTEAGFYRDIATVLGFSVFAGAIAESDYSDAVKDGYFSDCWDALNDILDESNATPSFASMTYAQYLAAEEEYFDLEAAVIDDPPKFEPGIAETDTRVYLDDSADFSVGDILHFKDGVSNNYWAEVAALGSDETGSYIDLTGKSGDLFEITPGQTVVNYGGIGAGGILLDGQSPLIDIYTHDGEPWNGTTPWMRMGNLEGWGLINHRCFGFAAGALAGHHIIYRADTGELTIAGNINIVAGSGLSNFADAGVLATRDDIDLSYVTDAGAAAGADDLDGISDGSTYKRTTQNEKTGAARAYSGLDSNNSLITKVIPGAAIGIPAGAGLFLGSDKLGFYNGGWKTYMDNSGNFGLVGAGTHGLTWNGSMLAIAGNVTILGGSGYGNLTDKPTALSGINSTEGSKLAGIENGADVTGSHTSADTNNVAGTAAATVRDNAANALANAATAQSTADSAVSSAATANSLLADIAADSKFTPSEKHAARQEWDIIAAERAEISLSAMSISGFSPGIVEASYGESAKNAYWSDCWSRIDDILDESNAEPTFPAQTYDEFVAEESEYFTAMQLALFDEPVTVPPVADVLALNTDYIDAFQSLADYLNAGSAWSSGVPSWISDANLGTTTTIVGATFRAIWKAYYDARTALLNAIAAKSKRIADLAQAAAGDVSLRVDSTLDKNNRLITAVVPGAAVSPDGAGLFMGSNYMGFYDDGWKTYMDNAGNFALIGDGAHGMAWDAARGVLTVVGDITVQDGGITTVKLATDAIKSANYSTATGSFLDLATGDIRMGGSSSPRFSFSSSTNTGVFAGFSFNATDLTAGSSSNAIGISTDAEKRAFWAGSDTPSSAPFQVNHNGDIYAVAGFIGGFELSDNNFLVAQGTTSAFRFRYSIGEPHSFASEDAGAGEYFYNSVGGIDWSFLGENIFAAGRFKMSAAVTGSAARSASIDVNFQFADPYNSNDGNYGQDYTRPVIKVTVASSTKYGLATNGILDAAGGFTQLSDRSMKTNIRDFDVMSKLPDIDVKQFLLDIDDTANDAVLKCGVMADQFNKTFGFQHESDKRVDIGDMAGVALRGLQQVIAVVENQWVVIRGLQNEIEILKGGFA